MNFEKRISTFLAAAAFALTSGLLSAAQSPLPTVLAAALSPALDPAAPTTLTFVTVGDCATVPAATCGPNSTTIVQTPSGLPQSCFGCPIGTQTSQWHSEPNPAPGNAPRLRLPKYKPNPAFCEQLIQVDIEATGTAQGLLKVEHRDALNECPNETLTLDVDMRLSALIGNPGFQPMNIPNIGGQILIQPPLAPYDGVTDFQGPSGAQRFIGPASTTVCQRFTGTDVSFFVDTTPTTTDDFMFFSHDANDSSSATPCTRVTFESDPFASLEVKVTYTVCRLTPPNLVNDTRNSTCRDTAININVFGNDSTDTPAVCPTPGTSTGITVTPPTAGTAVWFTDAACVNTVCSGTCIRFTPTPGSTASATITYSLSDTDGCTSSATVPVNVRTPPVLNDDTGAACPGSVIDVCVFANDTTDTQLNCPAVGTSAGISNIPAGWTAVWASNAGCAEGALTCTDIALRITPPVGFVGTLSPGIRYTLTDTDTCVDFADVSVTVRTPPVLVDDAGTGCPGAPIEVCVFANDTTDTALACPAVGSSTGITNIPAGWTATWVTNAGCAEGALTCNNLAIRVTPPAGFVGTLSPGIRYTLSDTDTCSDFADVAITVRTPPNLVDDTGAGCPGSPIDVCVFANDTTDTALVCPAAGSSTGITNIPAGWTAVWVANAACAEGALTCNNLAIRVTPPAGFVGTLSPGIRYSLSDTDTCSDFADVAITVRTPPNLVDDAGAGCPGSAIDVCVFANDTTDTALVCPAAGSSTGLTNIPAGWTAVWVANAACAEGALTCTDLALRVTPPAGFVGTLSPGIRYTLSDTDTCSDFADVAITVRTPPVLVDDAGAGCPGAPIEVCVFANDTTDTQLNCPAVGSSTGITNIPAGWTATWVANAGCAEGALTCTNIAMRITPPAGFVGTLSPGIRYTLSDTDTCVDFADVAVTVRTPPNLVDDSGTACPGAPIDVCVFANDTTDTALVCPAVGSSTGITNVPAGWTATWVANAGCAEGALTCTNIAMRITPPAGFTGTLAPGIRYTLSDTDTCSDFADVTVTVRTPPNLVDDTGTGCPGAPIEVCVFANDTTDTALVCPAIGSSTGITNVPAGWTATWVANAGCAEGALTCTNIAMRITPPAGFVGTLAPGIRYTLADTDTCSDFADVSVTVRTPPVLVDDSGSGCAGQPIEVCVFANDTSDTQLNCPAIGSSTGISNIPAGWTATWVSNGGCAEGALTCTNIAMRITPPAAFVGTLAPGIRYTLSDTDGCTDFADVSVTICRTQADDEMLTLCIGASQDVDVLLGDTSTCGAIQCPPILGAIPPQISVTPVNCGGPGCAGCVLRITALALPPGPPPFSVGFDYTVRASTAPFCEATGHVTVHLTPNPRLCDLPGLTKPPGDTTPIPFDVLACTPPPDPGPGCTFDLSTLVLIPPLPTQGNAVVNTLTGVITYTPFANFTGTDRVCYRIFNSCGCPDDACVDISDTQPCPTANRLECGSLLLFPEFDNTAGNLTLVTITDGCCGNTTSNARIEIVFIKKTTCLETNRTYTLTPCDTLSFVTNFIGPANSQGYLYAFAKSAATSPNNPGGTPIVYNHLIGQEVTMNGITQFEYAINAVSFKGFGAEGAPNDDDGDGIRDLNGLPDLALSEYEQAPDRILIPRFLGQDPAGAGANSYQSDIVLIALSGGASFTTLLDILVYNDNEEQFSDEHEFRCWEKLPLRDFSAWTLESSLKLSNHNPNEIRNFDNAHESGWIQINGATATSSAETINDPAFYAVLIERSGSKHGADLPFELCLQDNGDLLPRALFGDGPNPHAGDDQ